MYLSHTNPAQVSSVSVLGDSEGYSAKAKLSSMNNEKLPKIPKE